MQRVGMASSPLVAATILKLVATTGTAGTTGIHAMHAHRAQRNTTLCNHCRLQCLQLVLQVIALLTELNAPRALAITDRRADQLWWLLRLKLYQLLLIPQPCV